MKKKINIVLNQKEPGSKFFRVVRMTNATFYTPFGTKALGTVVIGDTIHEDAADILARDRGCEVVVNAALS